MSTQAETKPVRTAAAKKPATRATPTTKLQPTKKQVTTEKPATAKKSVAAKKPAATKKPIVISKAAAPKRRVVKPTPKPGEAPVPKQGYEPEDELELGKTVNPPSGVELVESVADIVGEIANSSLAAGGRLLKDAFSLLRRP